MTRKTDANRWLNEKFPARALNGEENREHVTRVAITFAWKTRKRIEKLVKGKEQQLINASAR